MNICLHCFGQGEDVSVINVNGIKKRNHKNSICIVCKDRMAVTTKQVEHIHASLASSEKT